MDQGDDRSIERRGRGALREMILQFVLIPLAGALVVAMLAPVADWIWRHR